MILPFQMGEDALSYLSTEAIHHLPLPLSAECTLLSYAFTLITELDTVH